MKILAAQRLLVVADADEQLARKYLREVAGIEVGRKLVSQPASITFEITKQQVGRATQELTRHFGTPKSSSNVVRYYGDLWYIDASKKRYVQTGTSSNKGPTETGFLITLVDLAHTETREEFLKRLLKPRYTKPM